MDKKLAAKVLRNPEIASLIIAAATGKAPGELHPVDIPECCRPEPQIGCDVVLYEDSEGRMYGLGRFPSDPCWFGSCYVIGDTMAQIGGSHIQGRHPTIALSDDGVEFAVAEIIQRETGVTLRTTAVDIPAPSQAALDELVGLLCNEELIPHTELGKKVKEVL